MPLMLKSGKLLVRNGKLATDPNCCCDGVNCCEILINFDNLVVSGDLDGIPLRGTDGEGNLCFSGGTDAPDKDYSIADFSICCVDNPGGASAVFVVTFTISFSAPGCDAVPIEQQFAQSLPCCPLNQTFEVDIPTACDPSGILTFTLQTPAGIPCP